MPIILSDTLTQRATPYSCHWEGVTNEGKKVSIYFSGGDISLSIDAKGKDGCWLSVDQKVYKPGNMTTHQMIELVEGRNNLHFQTT